jgi:hypothetical protein
MGLIKPAPVAGSALNAVAVGNGPVAPRGVLRRGHLNRDWKFPHRRSNTFTLVGLSRHPMMLMKVDLPEPDGPLTATNSPASMETLTSCTAVDGLSQLKAPGNRTVCNRSRGLPPERRVRSEQRVRSRIGYDFQAGCHPGKELRIWVLDRDDPGVGHHVGHGLRTQPDVLDLAFELTPGISGLS